MRRHWFQLCFGLVALAGLGTMARAPVGFDRAGGDYTSCEREPRCRAWAFSYPTTENANAVCWLKSRVPPRVEAACCVSGVRGTGVIEPKKEGAEFGVDRNGGDYRHFELPPDSSGKSCGTACQADESCRAWTYVRPGYVGSSAVCYLKNRITRPVRRPCCISGVIR
jgi:hypothetical protein